MGAVGRLVKGRKSCIITAMGKNKWSCPEYRQVRCVKMREKEARSSTVALILFWNTCIKEREGNNLQ